MNELIHHIYPKCTHEPENGLCRLCVTIKLQHSEVYLEINAAKDLHNDNKSL